MEKSLIVKIKKELQNIKKRYQEKYGAVFFDVKVKIIGAIIILEGVVLSVKQKNEILMFAEDITGNGKVEDNIKVLSEPDDKLEMGWAIVNAGPADVWAKLSLGGKKITGETRASQALKSDFVRVLAQKGKWSLVQTRDLAVGWMNSSFLIYSKWDVVKKEWLKARRIKKGEIFKKRLAKNIQTKFMGFLKKYLNSSYLLGGMTEDGVDCSGLTEKFYSDIFGVYLPRHSADQALCGEKIGLADAQFGDLVFLRNKIKKQAHIGLVVEKFEGPKSKRQDLNSILILNSRLEKGGVAIEELSDILKSYNLISVKRIIKEL